MPRTRASVPSSESPSQCTTSSALATHSHTFDSFDSAYAAAIPTDATTPSRVMWSGLTRRGRRAATERRIAALRTGEEELHLARCRHGAWPLS